MYIVGGKVSSASAPRVLPELLFKAKKVELIIILATQFLRHSYH